MSGSDVEDVQILGTLTKALTELFAPSKADRKNSGKNPPTINLGGISDEKFSEVFGEHLNPSSTLSKRYAEYNGQDQIIKNDNNFWEFAHALFERWKEVELSQDQTDIFLKYSGLSGRHYREETHIKIQLCHILKNFKIKYVEMRSTIASPILAITLLLDKIAEPWRQLMMKKYYGLRAGKLWLQMIETNDVFSKLRTVFEQCQESGELHDPGKVQQMQKLQENFMKMTKNVFCSLKSVPRALLDWTSYTFEATVPGTSPAETRRMLYIKNHQDDADCIWQDVRMDIGGASTDMSSGEVTIGDWFKGLCDPKSSLNDFRLYFMDLDFLRNFQALHLIQSQFIQTLEAHPFLVEYLTNAGYLIEDPGDPDPRRHLLLYSQANNQFYLQGLEVADTDPMDPQEPGGGGMTSPVVEDDQPRESNGNLPPTVSSQQNSNILENTGTLAASTQAEGGPNVSQASVSSSPPRTMNVSGEATMAQPGPSRLVMTVPAPISLGQWSPSDMSIQNVSQQNQDGRLFASTAVSEVNNINNVMDRAPSVPVPQVSAADLMGHGTLRRTSAPILGAGNSGANSTQPSNSFYGTQGPNVCGPLTSGRFQIYTTMSQLTSLGQSASLNFSVANDPNNPNLRLAHGQNTAINAQHLGHSGPFVPIPGSIPSAHGPMQGGPIPALTGHGGHHHQQRPITHTHAPQPIGGSFGNYPNVTGPGNGVPHAFGMQPGPPGVYNGYPAPMMLPGMNQPMYPPLIMGPNGPQLYNWNGPNMSNGQFFGPLNPPGQYGMSMSTGGNTVQIPSVSGGSQSHGSSGGPRPTGPTSGSSHGQQQPGHGEAGPSASTNVASNSANTSVSNQLPPHYPNHNQNNNARIVVDDSSMTRRNDHYNDEYFDQSVQRRRYESPRGPPGGGGRRYGDYQDGFDREPRRLDDSLIRAVKPNSRSNPVPPGFIDVICSRMYHKGGYTDADEAKLEHMINNLLEKARSVEDDLLAFPQVVKDINKYKSKAHINKESIKRMLNSLEDRTKDVYGSILVTVNDKEMSAYDYLSNLLSMWTEKDLALQEKEKKIEKKEKQNMMYVEKYTFNSVHNEKTCVEFIYEAQMLNCQLQQETGLQSTFTKKGLIEAAKNALPLDVRENIPINVSFMQLIQLAKDKFMLGRKLHDHIIEELIGLPDHGGKHSAALSNITTFLACMNQLQKFKALTELRDEYISSILVHRLFTYPKYKNDWVTIQTNFKKKTVQDQQNLIKTQLISGLKEMSEDTIIKVPILTGEAAEADIFQIPNQLEQQESALSSVSLLTVLDTRENTIDPTLNAQLFWIYVGQARSDMTTMHGHQQLANTAMEREKAISNAAFRGNNKNFKQKTNLNVAASSEPNHDQVETDNSTVSASTNAAKSKKPSYNYDTYPAFRDTREKDCVLMCEDKTHKGGNLTHCSQIVYADVEGRKKILDRVGHMVNKCCMRSVQDSHKPGEKCQFASCKHCNSDNNIFLCNCPGAKDFHEKIKKAHAKKRQLVQTGTPVAVARESAFGSAELHSAFGDADIYSQLVLGNSPHDTDSNNTDPTEPASDTSRTSVSRTCVVRTKFEENLNSSFHTKESFTSSSSSSSDSSQEETESEEEEFVSSCMGSDRPDQTKFQERRISVVPYSSSDSEQDALQKLNFKEETRIVSLVYESSSDSEEQAPLIPRKIKLVKQKQSHALAEYGDKLFKNLEMEDKQEFVDELALRFCGLKLLDMVNFFYSRNIFLINKSTLLSAFLDNNGKENIMDILVFIINGILDLLSEERGEPNHKNKDNEEEKKAALSLLNHLLTHHQELLKDNIVVNKEGIKVNFDDIKKSVHKRNLSEAGPSNPNEPSNVAKKSKSATSLSSCKQRLGRKVITLDDESSSDDDVICLDRSTPLSQIDGHIEDDSKNPLPSFQSSFTTKNSIDIVTISSSDSVTSDSPVNSENCFFSSPPPGPPC